MTYWLSRSCIALLIAGLALQQAYWVGRERRMHAWPIPVAWPDNCGWVVLPDSDMRDVWRSYTNCTWASRPGSCWLERLP